MKRVVSVAAPGIALVLGAWAQMQPTVACVWLLEPKDGAALTSVFKVVFGIKGTAVAPAGSTSPSSSWI